LIIRKIMTVTNLKNSFRTVQEQDFPGRNLLQRGSRTLEELLSGANFPQRLLQRVRSPERSAPAYF
jgi:hypothetical protein